MDNQKYSIKNFDLKRFKAIISQSLIVNPNLMFEFSEILRICAYNDKQTFMKLITIPLAKLTKQEEKELLVNNFVDAPCFDAFILKGDIFKKFLLVYNDDFVDIEFDLKPGNNNKLQATTLTVSSSSSKLSTKFVLTTEELIKDKVSDYSKLIDEVTPSNKMSNIIISSDKIQEIKRLVKTLSKALTVGNTPYLNFVVNKDSFTVSDKVFTKTFDFIENDSVNLKSEEIEFNILKTDFLILGEHNYNAFFTSEYSESDKEDQKLIFVTSYGGSIINCLSIKISSEGSTLLSDNIDETIDSIDSLDLSEYGIDGDLPF